MTPIGANTKSDKGIDTEFRDLAILALINPDRNNSYLEYRNLVETLEDLGRKKWLYGRDFFLCTDIMVSESIAIAGSSSTETLYDLVVQLHCLCMRYRCQVRFIHVAGTRIIGQITNGLSRGNFYKGIVNGKPMLSLLPLG